jgi:hypothetical protein
MLTTLLAGICSCQHSPRVRCTNLSTPFLEVAYSYAHLPAYAYLENFYSSHHLRGIPCWKRSQSILSLRPKNAVTGRPYWRRGHQIYETNSSLPICHSSPLLSPLPSFPIFIMPAFLFLFQITSCCSQLLFVYFCLLGYFVSGRP